MDFAPSNAVTLTIAIPTYNRPEYLRTGLEHLERQLRRVQRGLVEVIVSDNCSPDSTRAVVQDVSSDVMPIRYVRNAQNLGWARNFAQAFDMARGKYVLMFGDDDILVDGALELVLDRVRDRDYGVICLQPYGFDEDFQKERPTSPNRERLFRNPGSFLIATHRCFTLTSALVLNKSLLGGVDPREFIDTDIAIFHLMLRATLAGKESLFVERYLVGCKRNNSAHYDFADVFVRQFWRILDAQIRHGLDPCAVHKIERLRLFSYYPYYALKLRHSHEEEARSAYDKFAGRFKGRFLFDFWLGPTLWLRRPAGIAWGAITTAVGRAAAGDLGVGLKFAWRKIAGVRRRPARRVAGSASAIREANHP